MKAIIIGSGLAGLATAIRLQHSGIQTTVFEANNYPGGKLHSFSLGKYRFDGGPSLFTMPHFVEELFELTGRNTGDYFSFQKADEACRYFWEDGTFLKAYSDPEDFISEVERVLNFPSKTLRAYFAHIENIYKHSGKIFLEKPLNKASTWLNVDTVKALMRIRQYDIFQSMHESNRTRLGEPHLVQLFDRFATYNGSDPYRAPGILNVIPWLEHGFGTFFPNGGMVQIPLSLHRLAVDLGVHFEFNTRVTEIITKNGKATGIKTLFDYYDSDVVISNMDIHFTYEQLLKQAKPPKRILSQERSSSALVFYWGINKKFDRLGLHNIFFSDHYQSEFKNIFEKNQVDDDPTVYVNVSSKFKPNDAPSHGENWFVMVNTSHNAGQDWESIASDIRKTVLTKLSRMLKTSIEPLIEEEKIWTPKGIEQDTLSYKGALYGNSSNDKFAAFLRHPNNAGKYKNLFFCGGSVHPGGGIPLALLSGKITSSLILKT
ncbi:MAG: 1-hydroxycarotenoid 3,4-desaturase CrtD [Salibacteraceae bacterium]